MSLRVKNPLPQIQHILTFKQQPKILERLRRPKALHHALMKWRFRRRDIKNRGVRDLGAREALDGQEHVPAVRPPDGIPGEAVQVEY